MAPDQSEAWVRGAPCWASVKRPRLETQFCRKLLRSQSPFAPASLHGPMQCIEIPLSKRLPTLSFWDPPGPGPPKRCTTVTQWPNRSTVTIAKKLRVYILLVFKWAGTIRTWTPGHLAHGEWCLLVPAFRAAKAERLAMISTTSHLGVAVTLDIH